ncbi:hypothetical protein BI040_gp13 [Escherichia phage vB_EcoS_NBD2]|uniref:Uncharacterized protein n=1 Tax=Escherichia phage vB_EcoS_NBD2 TaxID=1852563 RepID=A0A192Y9G5_9CAUD|nr:hypothetical protein BI040_gp13 [Escherichia phage vB_EcoS_NBD2]ANM45855.1 hypothetical protein NBD2_13 [Escherichia phage vB_EcoS_NBD2]
MPLIKLTQPTNEAVMTIQRYTMRSVNGEPEMVAHGAGAYVTYASHAEELLRVQGELDALKDGLKRQIFAPLEKAMMNALIKTAMQATHTVYTVNPCDKLTSERVREIMDAQIGAGVISLAEVEERGFATGGFMAIPITRPDPESLLCIKSDAKSFKAGESYQCEANKDGALFVTQDEFVSDLNEDDYWHVTDGGAYYIVETIAGNAYFKK